MAIEGGLVGEIIHAPQGRVPHSPSSVEYDG